MRPFNILICISLTTLSSSFAASETEERSSILYVTGQVTSATETSCLVDIGAVHTIDGQDPLVVFRPIHGYFQPLGRMTVTEADATKCRCKNGIRSQPGDIVMAVREISQIRSGARQRDRIVRRQLVRSFRQTSSTTVNNVETANALSDYELQYPEWERSRGAVAGSLLSASLRESPDASLKRLRSQIDLMRRLYQQDAQIVAAAGTTWAGIMPLLAGRSAEAAHALRLLDLQDGDRPNDTASIAAAELRSQVFNRIFQLQPEQQNVVALIVASLIPGTARDSTILLRTSFSRTQFPDLVDDPQLLEDVGELILSIRDRNQG